MGGAQGVFKGAGTTWVRMCGGGQGTTSGAILQEHLTLCFKSGSPIGLGLADAVRLTGQGSSRISGVILCPPQDQNYKYMPQYLDSGNWTQVQWFKWLCGKH